MDGFTSEVFGVRQFAFSFSGVRGHMAYDMYFVCSV